MGGAGAGGGGGGGGGAPALPAPPPSGPAGAGWRHLSPAGRAGAGAAEGRGLRGRIQCPRPLHASANPEREGGDPAGFSVRVKRYTAGRP